MNKNTVLNKLIMEEEKMKIIHFVSKKYTYDMLKSLKDGVKRFKDLKGACESEKMRTQRLKELEEFDLISVEVKRMGRRPVSIYKLSERGNNILKLVERMKRYMKPI